MILVLCKFNKFHSGSEDLEETWVGAEQYIRDTAKEVQPSQVC